MRGSELGDCLSENEAPIVVAGIDHDCEESGARFACRLVTRAPALVTLHPSTGQVACMTVVEAILLRELLYRVRLD